MIILIFNIDKYNNKNFIRKINKYNYFLEKNKNNFI